MRGGSNGSWLELTCDKIRRDSVSLECIQSIALIRLFKLTVPWVAGPICGAIPIDSALQNSKAIASNIGAP